MVKSKTVESKPFDDLNELSKSLMGNSISLSTTDRQNQLKTMKLNEIINRTSTHNEIKNTDANLVFESLNSAFVELEAIKPAISIVPISLYDKHNIKIVLHFARNSPSKHINVVVISTTNMNMQSELKNFMFQAAVTKVGLFDQLI
jgi:hypothetical protein